MKSAKDLTNLINQQALSTKPQQSAQGEHLQSESASSNLAKLEWLWSMGGEIYRTKWQRDWGTAPSDTLGRLLGKLTTEQIKEGFGECVKRAQDGKEWPPTPIEFISLCKMAGLDVNGSFIRMINKQPPADKAEQQTRHQVGYNCRGMADQAARKLWADYYRKNFALMREGKLETKQPLALPSKVQTKTTDTMRDNFKPTTPDAAKLMQRLSKIRGE